MNQPESLQVVWSAGLMRAPTRLRITWLDEATLKLETDYGIQTRLLQFRAPAAAGSHADAAGCHHRAMGRGAGGRGRAAAGPRAAGR